MLYQLDGFVNSSKWGKIGEDSYIHNFIDITNFKLSPLAELWFGTHANGMTSIKVDGVSRSLVSYLESIDPVQNLPFLAKILSVDAPLSIQLHPSKSEAEKLHLSDPSHYPDRNPKPEMSIALTEVSLLCGFRDLDIIRSHICQIAAFSGLGEEFSKLLISGSIKDLTEHIFHLKGETLDSFSRAISESELQDEWSNQVRNLVRSGTRSDPGLVFLYFLEYLKLQPGEAIFIEPEVPHAYLSGDMFECMQTSDNVVRGGLTPKFIDSSNFIRLANCNRYEPRLLPKRTEQSILEYYPPECPFFVRHLKISAEVQLEIPAKSIILNLEGTALLETHKLTQSLGEYAGYFISNTSTSIKLSPTSSLETFIISPIE